MKSNLTIKKDWSTDTYNMTNLKNTVLNQKKKKEKRKSKLQNIAWFYLHEVQELLKLYTVIVIQTVIASGWWGQRNFWNDVHVIYLGYS